MEFQKTDYCDLQQVMLQRFPGLMNRLVLFEKSISTKGYQVRIGDGDRYSDFDIHIIGNGKDWSSIVDHLNSLIKSTCYKCGNTIINRFVSEYNYDNNLCDQCYSQSSPGLDKIRSYATLNYLAFKQKQNFTPPNIKIRLLNTKNEVFYEHLPNIYFTDDDFYVSNAKAQMELVRYAGMYLGYRDRNGERLYEGDIVLCKTSQENKHLSKLFWGLAAEYCLNKNKTDLLIFHGGDSFPSFLSWAEEFEVITNYFKVSQKKFTTSREFEYLYDWHLIEDLCENRAKELGWLK